MEKYNFGTFEKVVIYLLRKNNYLGEVQLRKALFFIDAAHFSNCGESLTGAKYIKKQFGPVPDNDHYHKLLNLYAQPFMDEMEINLTEDCVKICHFIKDEYKNEDEIKGIDFKNDIKDIILDSLDFVSKRTAKELSEITHRRGFNEVDMGDIIPFEKVIEWKTDYNFNLVPEYSEKRIREVEDDLKEELKR